jgi:hypothetical protein
VWGQRLLIAGAVICILLSTARLYADIGRPFDGMVTYHNVIAGNYVFSETTPVWWLTRRWDLLTVGQGLYTAEGRDYSEAPQVFAEVHARGGQHVTIEWEAEDGRDSALIPLIPFTFDLFMDLRAPTLLIALALLLVATLLHTTRYDSPQRHSLFLCTIAAAFSFGIDQPSLFWLEDELARALDLVSSLFHVLTSTALILIASSYITRGERARRVWAGIVWLAWAWAGLAFYLAVRGRWLLWTEGVTPLTQQADAAAYYSRNHLLGIATLLLTVTLAWVVVSNWRRRSTAPHIRASVRSAAALLLGLMLGQPSTLLNLANRLLGQRFDLFLGAFDLRFMMLFIPLFSTAAIVRHGAFGVRSHTLMLVVLTLSSGLAASLLNALFITAVLTPMGGTLPVIPSMFLPCFLSILGISSFWAFQSSITGWVGRWFRRGQNNLDRIEQFFTDIMGSLRLNNPYPRVIDALCAHFDLDYASLWLYQPRGERSSKRYTMQGERAHPNAPAQLPISLHPGEMREMAGKPFLSINPPDPELPGAMRRLRGHPLVEGVIPLVGSTPGGRADTPLMGFIIVSRCRDADILSDADMRALVQVARELAQHLMRIANERDLMDTRMRLHNELMGRVDMLVRQMNHFAGQYSGGNTPLDAPIRKWTDDLRAILEGLRRIHQGDFHEPLTLLKDKLVRIASSRTAPALAIDAHIDEQLPVPLDIQADLVQWATEALNNVVRHANATRVTVTLAHHRANDCVRLVVQDNGTGHRADEGRRGTGLEMIAEGVHRWGGTFTLEMPRFGGTRITIVLPCPQPQPAPIEPPPLPADTA